MCSQCLPEHLGGAGLRAARGWAIVIADPAAELLGLVRRCDGEPSAADRAAAALLRRRFAIALPPPFADATDPGDEEATPIRTAIAADGPAIGAVKWRSFGLAYRGTLPDAFLDGRDIVPPIAFWIGRAAVPPSRRHSLLVLGRPGHVLGYCDAGPCRDPDIDPAVTGEVFELYLDPSVLRGGGGRRLLSQAITRLHDTGSTDLRLWVLEGNAPGRAFYEACGWEPDGAARRDDLGIAVVEEVRYRPHVRSR